MKKIIKLVGLVALLCSFGGVSELKAADSYSQQAQPHFSFQYGSFYTNEDLVVAPEHSILFDRESVCSKGIEHVKGSGDFIIKEPGIYRVIYSVSLDDCDSGYWAQCKWHNVALTLNDQVLGGSQMYLGQEKHLSTLSLLVKVCGSCACNNVLRVINNNSIAKGLHNIRINSGDCDENVSASIVIEKIAGCAHDYCCGLETSK